MLKTKDLQTALGRCPICRTPQRKHIGPARFYHCGAVVIDEPGRVAIKQRCQDDLLAGFDDLPQAEVDSVVKGVLGE